MSLFSVGRDMIARVLPLVWVNEAVSLYRRTAVDTFGSADLCSYAKRGALDNRDLRVQQGLVPAGTVTFLLLASELTAAPRQHDKITDASAVSWYVNFVQLIVMNGSFYRCEVTKAV